MPIPVNEANAFTLDTTAVTATALKLVKDADDYGSDFSTDITAPINGQKTSTVLVRKAASVVLSDMPASRDGLLSRTGASADSVEVALTGDKYFKVGVDSLGVEPSKHAEEIGTAGAESIVRAGNANLVESVIAQGEAVEFSGTFGASTSEDQVWTALVDLITTLQERELDSDLVLYIKPRVWNKLITNVANLRTSVDPLASAATLLGVSRVRVANMTGALAFVAARAAVAQAKVIAGIRLDNEDFDQIVEGRVRFGTKVLESEAVLVLKDAA